METEKMVPLESKDNIEPLPVRIWAAAQEMGAPLSAEEFRVAAEGSRTEDEMWVPFRLSDRASSLSLLAREGISSLPDDPTARINPEIKVDGETRRQAGARQAVLKAACYLKAMPELAEKCLQYAKDVWEKKRDWDANNVPQPTKAEPEAEELRRAA